MKSYKSFPLTLLMLILMSAVLLTGCGRSKPRGEMYPDMEAMPEDCDDLYKERESNKYNTRRGAEDPRYRLMRQMGIDMAEVSKLDYQEHLRKLDVRLDKLESMEASLKELLSYSLQEGAETSPEHIGQMTRLAHDLTKGYQRATKMLMMAMEKYKMDQENQE